MGHRSQRKQSEAICFVNLRRNWRQKVILGVEKNDLFPQQHISQRGFNVQVYIY